jgi:hypothetical protein
MFFPSLISAIVHVDPDALVRVGERKLTRIQCRASVRWTYESVRPLMVYGKRD